MSNFGRENPYVGHSEKRAILWGAVHKLSGALAEPVISTKFNDFHCKLM
jgi:hypothetical protein